MTERFECGDTATLVGYLYDECDSVDHEAISSHVSTCGACAAELAALQSARAHLASWTPPEADLGFRVVGARGAGSRTPISLGTEPVGAGAGGPPPGSWWRQPLPAWAQAAAACLLFATGLWLGIVRGSAPAVLQTEPLADIATAGREPAAISAAPTPVPAASRAELEALERRLSDELTELRTETASAMAAPSGVSEAQVLARVRVLVEESERRQRRELALRTAQVVRDIDSQRQVDLAQIERNFGQIEGLTGAEVREQREMLNYLMRVSEQR